MNKKQTNKLLKELAEAGRNKDFAVMAEKLAELPQSPEILEDQKLKEAFVLSGLSNDLELVKRFLDLGLSINTEYKQSSILGFAARIPFPDFLRALIDLGANPDHLDAMNASPLVHLSRISSKRDSRDHFIQSLILLIERSTCINTGDFLLRTPLDYCVKGEWFDAVKLLLDNGARLDACDSDGQDALRSAAMGSEANILKLLLQQEGALLVAERSLGDAASVIAYAANYGRLRNVELMVAAGVSDQLTNGNSALEVAAKVSKAMDATLSQFGIKRNSS